MALHAKYLIYLYEVGLQGGWIIHKVIETLVLTTALPPVRI